MDVTAFQIVFLTTFSLAILAEWGLIALNQGETRWHRVLPAAFRGCYDEETFSRSREYALERMAFDKFSLLYSALLSLVWLFSGLLPALDRFLEHSLGRSLHAGVYFLAGVGLLQALLKLPLGAFSTFRIEGKFGFNHTTWKVFWSDAAKGVLVSLLLGIPFLYALLALVAHGGAWWWLWALLFILAFQVLAALIYPVFIAPLFNSYKPLEDGAIKDSLLALAGRLRFPSRGLYVVDGSRRSAHSNAYFTGFGKWRRIVLFDTLLRQMEERELAAILAHEIGHYRLKHIYKTLAVRSLALAALLGALSLVLEWDVFYRAFSYQGPVPAVGLFLALTVFSSVSIFFAPLGNRLSRKYEYEADAFAVEACGDSGAMRSALIKLSRNNLSNLTPHSLYSSFHHSHPSLRERLHAIGI